MNGATRSNWGTLMLDYGTAAKLLKIMFKNQHYTHRHTQRHTHTLYIHTYIQTDRQSDLVKDQENIISMEEMFCDSVLVTVFSSRSRDGGLMVHITEELPGKRTTLMFSCLNSN